MVVGRESDGSTRRDCDRYRQRQLKAGLYKTKNFDCPLQFEMCRKIKNFKGLSAGQWQMFARTRASAPFVLFVFSQFSRWHFFYFFLMLLKNRSGLWCRQVLVSKVSPPDPHCRVFSGTREANASAQYGPSFSILSHLSPILVIFIVCDLLVVTNPSQHDGSSVCLVWLERRHCEWYLRWQYYHQ